MLLSLVTPDLIDEVRPVRQSTIERCDQHARGFTAMLELEKFTFEFWAPAR
jgi:hypothetical protein